MPTRLPALAFITGLLLTPVTHAALISWRYVGPDFDTPDPLPLPYTVGDHIEGYITIEDSFLDAAGNGLLTASRVGGVEPWLADLTFTDGVQTVTSADLATLGEWFVNLRFQANVLRVWDMFLAPSSTPPLRNIITGCGDLASPIETDWCGGTGVMSGLRDSAIFNGAEVFISVDDSSSLPPLWTASPAEVPTPPSVALIALGSAGLGYWYRRRRKQDSVTPTAAVRR